MHARSIAIPLLFAIVCLAGCGQVGRPHPVSHHVLRVADAGAAAAPANAAARQGVLLVRDTETPGVFQSVRLVYSRTPDTLSYYQYARWSEAPARSLNAHLRQRLNTAGPFEPAAIEVMDVHAWLELVGANLLDHRAILAGHRKS